MNGKEEQVRSNDEKSEQKNGALEESKEYLKRVSRKLERQITTKEEFEMEEIREIFKEVEKTAKSGLETVPVSEYVIVEKHDVTMWLTRVLVLIKILKRSQEIDEMVAEIDKKYPLEMLTRNLRVCEGEADRSVGILVESLFCNMMRNSSAFMRKIEMARNIRDKISVKRRLEGKESEFDAYLEKQARTYIDEKINEMGAISHKLPLHKLCEVLEGVLETGNKQLLAEILRLSAETCVENGDYSVLSLRRVLLELAQIEIEAGKGEKERDKKHEYYLLMLKIAKSYVKKTKRRRGAKGRDALEEIFDEEEIDMMCKLLEKELPVEIHAEILGVLVEGGVHLEKPESVEVTYQNVQVLMKYVLKNPEDTETLLMNIINALETYLLCKDEEQDGVLPVVVLDFLNEMTKRYARYSDANAVSFQRYVANYALDLYGGILSSSANPLILCGYLRLLSSLLGIQESKGCSESVNGVASGVIGGVEGGIGDGVTGDSHNEHEKERPYFSSAINRNYVLTRNITTIMNAMRQLSMYVIQEEMLYAEMEAEGARCFGELEKGNGVSEVEKSVSNLFLIALSLPNTMKVALASGHLMNIVFRELSRSQRVSETSLCFIRGFFASEQVVQKVSSSAGNNFFTLVLALVNRGEIESAQVLLEKNQRMYKGFFTYRVISGDLIRRFKDRPSIYLLAASLMVYYYAQETPGTGNSIDKAILDVFEGALSSIRSSGHIAEALGGTREFGAFFKAAVLLSRSLELDVEDVLYLLVKAQMPLENSSKIKTPTTEVLYRCKSKVVAECFYFYHFMNGKEIEEGAVGKAENQGRMCLAELADPFTSTVLKYISLLWLKGGVGRGSAEAAQISEMDLSEMMGEERRLFVHQIYRALFLSGAVQGRGAGVSLPLGEEIGKKNAYSDMCIRSAIKATEDGGAPCTLPISVVSEGSSHLVAAFLYTLYESAPNSAVVQSYIRKMRRFVREENSVYARVLSSVCS